MAEEVDDGVGRLSEAEDALAAAFRSLKSGPRYATFRCPDCGKTVRRGRHATRCGACQEKHTRERRRLAQQNRRQLRAGLVARQVMGIFAVYVPVKVPCAQCGNEFEAQRTTARFCSDKCRVYFNRARAKPPAEKKPGRKKKG
jgi:endogenous inhibitor of DNA gyrase (YacG/DUF329 family)